MIFKRGETAEFKFIFIDAATNEKIDVVNPLYRIVYYDTDLSGIEIEVVPSTSLTHIDTGEYLATWDIPSIALANQQYFVEATGTHPVDATSTELEEQFKIVTDDYFQGAAGGLVVKFTKD
jgi:hypothetical protein